MATYRGSCHCGAVRFEVEGAIESPEVCNCSICRRTAYVHWEVPPERFRLIGGEEALREYRFGTGTARHLFCGTCGVSAFRHSRASPQLVDVNCRCLEGVDVGALQVGHFDGRHWERAIRGGRG